jgi:hypothetical protein
LKDELKIHASCVENEKIKFAEGELKAYNDQKSERTKVFDLVKACQYQSELWTRVEWCNNRLTTMCFDSKTVQLVQLVHSLFELRCESSYIHGMIDEKKFKEFPYVAERIIGYDARSYFKSLVTFDKSCTIHQMAVEIGYTQYPCFGGIGSMFYRPVEYYFNERDNATFPGYISSCKTITSGLKSCLNENACFSQNEMDLVGEWASTIYQWFMGIVVQITDNFGSIGNDGQRLRDTTFKFKKEEFPLSQIFDDDDALRFDGDRIGDDIAKILKTVDFVIKDFKNKDCKRNLSGVPKLSYCNAN